MNTRVSTRDQILEALSYREALTLKELAESCTACDHDEQIVGTMIAILHRENVIHPGQELRDGLTVWIFGKEPVEEHQPPISLAGADRSPRAHLSEAALAISNMRGGSGAQKRPHTASAAGDADVATMQSAADGQARENIIRIFKAHGPMESRGLRKHGSFGVNLPHTLAVMAEQKQLVRFGGGPRSTVFGLPGQTLKDQKSKPTQPEKWRDPAPLSRKANGGGGAVTPAVGPAIAVAKPAQPETHREIQADLERWGAECLASRTEKFFGGDNLYKAALLDLQDRRAAVVEQLAKIDRAIEAMGALA